MDSEQEYVIDQSANNSLWFQRTGSLREVPPIISLSGCRSLNERLVVGKVFMLIKQRHFDEFVRINAICKLQGTVVTMQGT